SQHLAIDVVDRSCREQQGADPPAIAPRRDHSPALPTISSAVLRSTEFGPAMIWNSPGSTVYCIASFQYANASLPSVNSTVVVAPGCSVTRRNPLSSLTGRVIELTTSRTYSCTTSSPATAPVLRTSTDTVTVSVGAIRAAESRGVPMSNVVYDRP